MSCDKIPSGCHRFKNGRGATRTGAIARVTARSGVVEDPRHTYKLHAREPGDLGDTCRPTDGRSASEGDGRTARVYVSEESHRGIVPMNPSNKDGASSAEMEEGRLRLKENTFPFDTYPTQRGTARVPRWASVRTIDKFGRHFSERRTGCANERPSGSVQGALGDRCPYRDQQLTSP